VLSLSKHLVETNFELLRVHQSYPLRDQDQGDRERGRTSSAIVLFVTSHFGMPVSTTHVISGSIFGVGTSKRLSAVRWGVAQSMIMAWVLTLPAAGLVAALSYELVMLMGLGR
jgi:hypothetical protein